MEGMKRIFTLRAPTLEFGDGLLAYFPKFSVVLMRCVKRAFNTPN